MIRSLVVVVVLVVMVAVLVVCVDDQVFVRVIVEAVSVRIGLGFGYCIVYRANQGEVLIVIGRVTHDHWFRVELFDGIYGWVLGDEVFLLDVDIAVVYRGLSIWKWMGYAMFSLFLLTSENVIFTFSVGVLGGDGMFLFWFVVLLVSHVSLEGTIGEMVGNQVDVIYVVGGFNVYLFLSSFVMLFVGGVAGGVFGCKKVDQFAVWIVNYSMVNVGGGLVMSLKKWITLRGDVCYYVIFNVNYTQRIQEYSGVLAVFF